jgi:hypothetical protein
MILKRTLVDFPAKIKGPMSAHAICLILPNPISAMLMTHAYNVAAAVGSL